MIGRQRELAEIEQRFAAARDGHPALAVVEGPTGIGKTALVEHVLSREDGLHVRWVDGMSWEQDLPLELLRRAVLRDPGAEDAGDGTDDSPAAAGQRLAERWRTASEHPSVVVVDDAHWADLASLRALASAVRRLSAEPVLVLLLARTPPGASGSAEVDDFLLQHRETAVQLGPLSAADAQTIAARCSGVDLPSPAAQQLCAHTGGNPRHIAELLDEVPVEHWLEGQPDLPAPRSVTATVSRALDACGKPARGLVEAAAVLGDSLPFAEAARLSDVTGPVAALDEASRRGLLATSDIRGLTTVTFPDSMVRAAVCAQLAPLRRQQLHGEAAEIVEDEHTRLSHRVALTPFPDAHLADELDEFASRQAAVGAWSVVADALVSASRLSPGRVERAERLVRAVDALVGAGDLSRALAFAPAVESSAESPLRDAVLGYLAILQGRSEEAEMLLTRAWQQCDRDREPATAALICQRRVLHAMSRWRGPELVSWGREAVQLSTSESPAAVESEAIMGLGLAATGLPADARAAYDEVANRITRGAQSQRVQMGKGWLDLALDDPLTARWELHSAVPTRYRMGSTRISLWAQAWLARTEFALGAWDDAIRTVNRAVAQLETTGLELLRPLVHWTGAQTHALRGNWDEARTHLRLASAGPHDYEVMLIPSCIARAQCAEAQADYETVLRALEPLTRIRIRQGIDEPGFWPWHDIYANALVVTNRVEEADAFLDPHERRAQEREHRSTRARLGYVRGRIAAARGDIDAAKDAFEGSLTQLVGLPLPYERARVNFAYGQTLRRAGKRREADNVLHNARDAYSALGAGAYVQRCDRELKAGGMHGKRAAADLTELTAQEKAVAALVARGMTNRQAAVELFISVKTVQFHLTSVYGKLGIATRAKLAAHLRPEE